MYEKIAQELKSMDLVDSHPQDYLNFYCIGKREEIPQELSSDNGGLVII
jgi:phospholipase D1/2